MLIYSCQQILKQSYSKETSNAESEYMNICPFFGLRKAQMHAKLPKITSIDHGYIAVYICMSVVRKIEFPKNRLSIFCDFFKGPREVNNYPEVFQSRSIGVIYSN